MASISDETSRQTSRRTAGSRTARLPVPVPRSTTSSSGPIGAPLDHPPQRPGVSGPDRVGLIEHVGVVARRLGVVVEGVGVSAAHVRHRTVGTTRRSWPRIGASVPVRGPPTTVLRMRQHDVVVIGGGHNGLVAAGLLAKSGSRVLVLERRPKVGGAAITETPWGPDYKMTALSYVVSLMPPTVVRELELERHGYKVYPQGPYFAPHPDGRHLLLSDDPIVAAQGGVQVLQPRCGRPRRLGRLAGLAWPTCSVRSSPGCHPGSARSGPPTSSTCPDSAGSCATSTSRPPATSPGCSPRASPTCWTTTSRAQSSRACWRSAASSGPGPGRAHRARRT